ncbi:hypothetical protein [uncultured Sphingomonas sp.]|uniref:hypothetical protein n=1 Tax=uncultured Sphingomonas sp. TaxID=158754 RepID=UPI0025D45406|nr:hypothetical protein [uncultured Sphingomonas sp.]
MNWPFNVNGRPTPQATAGVVAVDYTYLFGVPRTAVRYDPQLRKPRAATPVDLRRVSELLRNPEPVKPEAA